MPEAPVTTIGILHEPVPPTAHVVELRNGKRIVGHLPARLAGIASQLQPGCRVHLEMTPYDFEKARIVGIATDA